LLHVCCVHCTAYTVEYWRKQDYDVRAFWYNPNIHPESEYHNRLNAMRTLAREMNFPLIEEESDVTNYFQAVKDDLQSRCKFCYELRLDRTAIRAKEGSYAGFSTTMLISPQQKHDWLQNMGIKAAQNSEIEFLYVDLRKRYSDSRHITKPMNLYRQQYCGCIFSKLERCFETKNQH
jgi:epoxyqueuosine reductase